MCYATRTKSSRPLQYRREHCVPLQISASRVAHQGHRVASGINHSIIPPEHAMQNTSYAAIIYSIHPDAMLSVKHYPD